MGQQKPLHPPGEAEWASYRKHFPVTQQWTYLQHASIGPPPAQAVEAQLRIVQSQSTHGTENLDLWRRKMDDVRALAAAFINASPSEVSFIRNTAEGLSRIALGLRWKPGDNVIVNSMEYPTNILPWLALREQGVEIRRLDVRGPRIHVDDFRPLTDRRTRLIAVSSVQFSNGFRIDLDQLSTFCRERGILLSVDAIQHLGVVPLDVQGTPVDFLSAGGHKWLLSPCGSGIFYVRQELLDSLRVVEVGLAGTSLEDLAGNPWQQPVPFRRDAGRFEGGLPAFGPIVGLGAAITLLRDIGIRSIWARVEFLTDYLTDRLQQLGFQVLSPREAEPEKSGIVSAVHPSVPADDLQRCLRQRGISVSVRPVHHQRVLRVSPHFYNSLDELDQLCAVIKDRLRR